MADIGLKLSFEDSAGAVAFGRELERIDLEGRDFSVVTFGPKLNFDAVTLALVLKVAGEAAAGVAGFLSLTQAILKTIKKPKVRIEIDGKQVDLYAQASIDDIKQLCDILDRSSQ